MPYPKPKPSAGLIIAGIVVLLIGYLMSRFPGDMPSMPIIGMLVAVAGLITILVGVGRALNALDNMAALGRSPKRQRDGVTAGD